MQTGFLKHHGIKGQKWGVRRGPPYPIGSGGKPNPFNTPMSSISKTAIDTGKTLVGQALSGDPVEYGVQNPNAYNVVMDWYENDYAKNQTFDDNAKPPTKLPPTTEELDPDLNNYAYERFTGKNQNLDLTPTRQSVYDQILDPNSPLFERSEWELESLRDKYFWLDDASQKKRLRPEIDALSDTVSKENRAERKRLQENQKLYEEIRDNAAKTEKARYENLKPFAEDILEKAYEQNAPRLTHEETSDEAVKAVNPKFGQEGYTENCTGCSAAFDMRKRGYDVQAGEYLRGGLSDEQVASTFYKNAPGFTEGHDEIDNVMETTRTAGGSTEDVQRAAGQKLDDLILDSTPDGGRGMLHGSHYATGGLTGHSIAYEVEDGQVKYRDCQVGETYTGGYDMVESEGFLYDTCRFMRTDNLEPNWMALGGQYRIGRSD